MDNYQTKMDNRMGTGIQVTSITAGVVIGILLLVVITTQPNNTNVPLIPDNGLPETQNSGNDNGANNDNDNSLQLEIQSSTTPEPEEIEQTSLDNQNEQTVTNNQQNENSGGGVNTVDAPESPIVPPNNNQETENNSNNIVTSGAGGGGGGHGHKSSNDNVDDNNENENNNNSNNPTYHLSILEGNQPSDGIIIMNQEFTVVATTDNLNISTVTFRWISPTDEIVQQTLTSLNPAAEENFTPDQPGNWKVEADFGNGVVLSDTVNVPFLVLPESGIGTLALVGSSIAALGGYYFMTMSRGRIHLPKN